MKRLLLLAALLVVALPLFAFDANRTPARIGVLRVSYEEPRDAGVAETITKALREELRAKGFDAFDAGVTWNDLRENEIDDGADYYVEILAADAYGDSHGGIGIGGNHVGVSIEMITARVAAELRVYDARTMDVIASETLAKKKNSVAPASIGIGGRAFYAILAAPLHRLGMRNAANAVAREAASVVADTLGER